MLSALDVLSRYKVDLDDRMQHASSIISKFMELDEGFDAFIDLKAGDVLDFNASDWNAVVEICRDFLANTTFVLPSGDLLPLGFKTENPQPKTVLHTLYNTVSGSPIIQLKQVYPGPNSRPKRTVICPNVEGTILPGDLIKSLGDTYSQSEVISQAISLVEAGELNAQNFISALGNRAFDLNSSTSAVVANIRDAITGTSSYAQASSLLSCLREMFNGVNTATASDEDYKITFNDTEFSVSTAVLFPIQAVVTVASAALGMILSFINPVVGALVTGVGAAVGAFVNAINENNNDEFTVNDRAVCDNDCFATPLIQKVVPTESLNDDIKTNLKRRGMLKLVNGFGSWYLWYTDDSQSSTGCEFYASANADVTRFSPNVSDLLYKHITHSTVVSTETEKVSAFNIPSVTAIKTDMEYWLEDGLMPGADGLTVEHAKSTCATNVLFNLLCRRHMYSTALVAMWLLSASGKNTNSFTPVDIALWQSSSMPKDVTSEQVLASFLGYLTLGGDRLSDIYIPKAAGDEADLVNNVVPSLLAFQDGLSGDVIASIVNMFAVNSDSNINSLSSRGQGSTYAVSFGFFNKANALVFPPKCSVSIWARVAIAAVAIATVAVVAAVMKTKVKRKIQFKAQAAQANIQRLADKAAETGSYEDWRAADKATRKYNKFLGLLTGTTFDLRNKWVNQSATTSTASNLVGSLLSNSDGQGTLKVDLTTIAELIRGPVSP